MPGCVSRHWSSIYRDGPDRTGPITGDTCTGDLDRYRLVEGNKGRVISVVQNVYVDAARPSAPHPPTYFGVTYSPILCLR